MKHINKTNGNGMYFTDTKTIYNTALVGKLDIDLKDVVIRYGFGENYTLKVMSDTTPVNVVNMKNILSMNQNLTLAHFELELAKERSFANQSKRIERLIELGAPLDLLEREKTRLTNPDTSLEPWLFGSYYSSPLFMFDNPNIGIPIVNSVFLELGSLFYSKFCEIDSYLLSKFRKLSFAVDEDDLIQEYDELIEITEKSRHEFRLEDRVEEMLSKIPNGLLSHIANVGDEKMLHRIVYKDVNDIANIRFSSIVADANKLESKVFRTHYLKYEHMPLDILNEYKNILSKNINKTRNKAYCGLLDTVDAKMILNYETRNTRLF